MVIYRFKSHKIDEWGVSTPFLFLLEMSFLSFPTLYIYLYILLLFYRIQSKIKIDIIDIELVIK